MAAARRVLLQLDHSRDLQAEDAPVNRADAYRICRLFIAQNVEVDMCTMLDKEFEKYENRQPNIWTGGDDG